MSRPTLDPVAAAAAIEIIGSDRGHFPPCRRRRSSGAHLCASLGPIGRRLFVWLARCLGLETGRRNADWLLRAIHCSRASPRSTRHTEPADHLSCCDQVDSIILRNSFEGPPSSQPASRSGDSNNLSRRGPNVSSFGLYRKFTGARTWSGLIGAGRGSARVECVAQLAKCFNCSTTMSVCHSPARSLKIRTLFPSVSSSFEGIRENARERERERESQRGML